MEAKQITSVSEYLINYLRTEIITGGLAPGEKASEYHLAETLNVSRPILREVLRTLESEGLVLNVPRKGSFISDISLVDFNELYEIREMIETKAIELLKRKAIRSIPDLNAVIQKESKLEIPPPGASPSVFLEFFEIGFQFHSLLIKAAGNRRLFQYYQGIQYNLLRYHVLQGPEDLGEKTKIDHSDLVEKLNKGDYEKATDYLQEHIRLHAEIIRTNLKSHESGELASVR